MQICVLLGRKLHAGTITELQHMHAQFLLPSGCWGTLGFGIGRQGHACADVMEAVLQAVERSERPWLMLLTSLSALSALLLALVFWKLHSIQ